MCTNDIVCLGRPVDNTHIYLLNKQLEVVPEGEVGELYVSGLNVCSGYINDRDAHKFVTNHHTVDPGELTSGDRSSPS